MTDVMTEILPEKNIYTLALHERLSIDTELSVIRVPGGWIYETWRLIQKDEYGQSEVVCSVFVPFKLEHLA